LIDKGQIAEEGTHESLLKNNGSAYKKLWELQAGGFLK
jgi:ABC-type multidrug transport system fused ATPase/permease subunit